MLCIFSYILDNSEVVGGKSVLDVGCGCGASSIAAVLSGAEAVLANDIDVGRLTIAPWSHTLQRERKTDTVGKQ